MLKINNVKLCKILKLLFPFKRGAPQETEKLIPRRRSSMGMRADTLSILPEYEDSEVSSNDLPRVKIFNIYKYSYFI